MMLKRLLAHPLARDRDPDHPETTIITGEIIRSKKFLYRLYQEWYDQIRKALPPGPGPVLELGSGAGFLKEIIPEVIPSDIRPTPELALVLDGQALPFTTGSLRAIVMVDVLHHLPNPRLFFSEAGRCLRQEGGLILIEPWVTRWSQVVYGRWHHEPFTPGTADWEFPARGPLSGANLALPWIIFQRDQNQFKREFPEWELQQVIPMMPFRYLLSGGVSLRCLVPAWSYGFFRLLEKGLDPWADWLAMFAKIVLKRRVPAP